MKTTLLMISTALAIGLAGCDRNPNPPAKSAPGTPPATSSTPSTPQASTPTTPANVGTPSTAEKASGSQPVQGQVDPKQGEQQKDFQQKGDGAGPKK